MEHKASGVYWGSPGFADKHSYHASGQLHRKRQGPAEDVVHHTPLASLKGLFQLTSMTVGNVRGFVQTAAPRYEYSGRKSDVVLSVDARAVPPRAETSIWIGLLEPGNSAALLSIAAFTASVPGGQLTPQQLLLSTAVKPWVYASVLWWIKDAR
jgi:hypothetical protein